MDCRTWLATAGNAELASGVRRRQSLKHEAADIKEEVLRTFGGKGGDEQSAAAPHGIFYHVLKLLLALGVLRTHLVAIGAFHQ